MKVLKVRRYKIGYEVREELDTVIADGKGYIMKSAYTVPEGYYIGSSVDAYRKIVKMGLRKLQPTQLGAEGNGGRGTTCAIGFQPEKQGWAGWSHRAIVLFGIGDKIFEADYGDDNTLFVQHGEVVIETLDQAKQAAINFAEYAS